MKIKKIKKAAFFSPYLDTLGGGERYFFSVINWAANNGFQINLFWPNKDIIKQAEKRFGFSFPEKNINIDPSGYILFYKTSFWERIGIFDNFDFTFFVSDGSIPFLAKKGLNLIHFQVPFLQVKKGWLWFLKKRNISYFVYNSKFTQNLVQPQLGNVASVVIYPPVNLSMFHEPVVKRKIILAVGRFDQTMQAKRQDLLVSAFKKLTTKLPGWKLILAGGTTNQDYWLSPLKKQAKGYPIDFLVNVSWSKLRTLYQQATIFWHAAGFGVNPAKNPEKMEHFGITPVEALAAGCIPIVYNGGGLPEIIKHKENGYLFSSEEELIHFTLDALNNKQNFTFPKLRNSVKKFDQSNFYRNLDQLWKKHVI